MLTEPTSLNRGEGLVTGLLGDIGGGVGVSKGGGGWWWTKKNDIQL